MLENGTYKMNKYISILILSLICQNCFPQSKIIRGHIFDYKTNSRVPGTLIFIDSIRGVISDPSGDFNLKVYNVSKSDTVRIRYISSFDLNIILPLNIDTIELGGIPLFDDYPGYDMTDYFCKWYDFACKRRWKKHMKQEQERIMKYYLDQKKIFEEYVYYYNGKYYKINLETHCIDLSKRFD